LLFDNKGNLYSTTLNSGGIYYGTVYQLSPSTETNSWGYRPFAGRQPRISSASFFWLRVAGHASKVLSALAGIMHPKLKALPASAPEGLIFGDRQMTAFATDISPVRNDDQRREIVA
jgi:hypothetical protein